VVFSLLHPLAESDPAERPDAREETPAAEAADWLQNPTETSQLSPTMRLLLMLRDEEPWTGPLPSEQEEPEEELHA
jgi:hypothetical protein